jgi:hypothetical protein
LKFKAKNAKAAMAKIKVKIRQRVDVASGKHADAFIKLFQEKLINGDFKPRLKRSTVRQKRRKGYDLPETPLYGRGLRVKSSMINGLKPFKTKNGVWRIRPTGKHQKMAMSKLFAIHEFGATLKNGGKIAARKPIGKTVKAYKASTEYKNINHTITKGLFK